MTTDQAMVAALFVERNGCYFGLPNVDPWDIERDARLYQGPHPVVAHPPCERWGRYWFGSPSGRVRKKRGDDGGCFAYALSAVRTYGGVLEHPEASSAWSAHGLITPPKSGHWIAAGDFVGFTCCVEQGHYGHKARKATWLYAAHAKLPSLKWGSSGNRAYIAAPSARRQASMSRRVEHLSHRERAATPIPFRDLLLSIARGVREGVAA